jgi:CBS domain containing-hemolysin-like protein
MEDAALRAALGLLAVLALVLINGFFVAAEFSLVTVRKTRIDQLIAEGNRMARTVRRAVSNPDPFIAATQLGITMASIGLGWIGEPAIASTIQPAFAFLPTALATTTVHSIATAVAFAIITGLHIVFGELAPKTVALQHAERTALIVAKPTEIFMRVFWPFISLLNGMGRAAVRAIGLREPSGHSMVHSEEELKMLVTASQEAGVLEEAEEQMLHRVFNFGDMTAGQLMIPRTEITAIPVDATREEVVERFSRGSMSWLPVYRGAMDDIVGILYAVDVLRTMTTPGVFSVANLVREVLTVPETMTADDVLAEMRRRRTHQAVVIDEYGGTAGLVTFEGLMERIVGAVGIEQGRVRPRIDVRPDGSAEMDGLTLVADVNERFGLDIDEEMYTTIGGYVLGRLGRRPRIGDIVEADGRTIRVQALDGLRVERVLLSPPRVPTAEEVVEDR